MGRYSLFRKIAKNKSGKQLMNEISFEYLKDFPQFVDNVLIIAGNLSLNPFVNQNDGTVLVDETALDKPYKHIILPRGHITIVFSKKVFFVI